MVEMELFRVRIDDRRSGQVITLREKGGKRVLPIVIGVFEADAIRLKLNNVKLPRPLTHDLLLNTVGKLGFRVSKVLIHALVEGTFYARLILSGSDHDTREIDARPSDAIALALRAGAPIYANENLLEPTTEEAS